MKKYTKNYIGKGTQVAGMEIVKITLKVEEHLFQNWPYLKTLPAIQIKPINRIVIYPIYPFIFYFYTASSCIGKQQIVPMNKSLPSRFTVSIPVKPYVKRFLDINFGLPVDFTQNAHSHKHFQSLFKNPNTSQDKKYPDHICTYTEIVEVVISEHDFYRYGWELTKTNTIAFGRYYEERAKAMMRTYIGVNISLGCPHQ